MIAQSLSCDPKLLIADEPTTALDVTVQAEILDLMRNLRNKLDSAIVLITHDMGVVADLADRIAVMRKGVIVETGTAQQIFRNPQHEYTQALLAAVPAPGAGRSGPRPTSTSPRHWLRRPTLSLSPSTMTNWSAGNARTQAAFEGSGGRSGQAQGRSRA